MAGRRTLTRLRDLDDISGSLGAGVAPVYDGASAFVLTDIATQAEIDAGLLLAPILAPAAALRNTIQPTTWVSALTLKMAPLAVTTGGAFPALKIVDDQGREAFRYYLTREGSSFQQMGLNGRWGVGIDSAAATPYRDFFISKDDFPSAGLSDDIIYIGHRGALNPSIGLGVKTATATGAYRTVVSAPGTVGAVSEAAMGSLGVLVAAGQTGSLFAIANTDATYEYARFSATTLGKLEFRPDGARDVLGVRSPGVGDTVDRLTIDNYGVLRLGPGNAAVDLTINRDKTLGTNTQVSLKVTDNLWVAGAMIVGGGATDLTLAQFQVRSAGAAAASMVVATPFGGNLGISAIAGSPFTCTIRTNNASPLEIGANNITALTIDTSGHVTVTDAKNLILGTGTGTKIGTGATQKLGFYGATPVVQQGPTTDLRVALINLGLYATGGESDLSLNGGALHAGTDSLFTADVGTGIAFTVRTAGEAGERLRVRGDGAILIYDGAGAFQATLLVPVTGGFKIGGATTQKIGFYGVTPVVQGAAVANASGGGTIDTEARAALNALLARIRDLGLVAA